MRSCLPALLLLAGGSAVPCQSAPPQSLSPAQNVDAADALRFTPQGVSDVFALQPIGIGRQQSAKQNAYEAILLRPDAPQIFLSLLDNPSVATQMYALAGLRLTDPAAFDRAFARFSKRRDTVSYMSGCTSFNMTVGDIARDLRSGRNGLWLSPLAPLPPHAAQAAAAAFLLGNADGGHVFSLSAPSTEYAAFNTIKERKDAAVVFRSLLYSSDSATQLYGLAGLAQTAPTTFKHLAAPYLPRRNAVQFKHGSTDYVRPFGDCVRDLLAGRAPDQFPQTK